MQIILDAHNKNSGIITEHKGEQIAWRSSKWSQIKTCDVNEVFGTLNDYWEHKGEKFQDEIYSLYKKAHEVIEATTDFEKLNRDLSKISCELVDLHDLETIEKLIKVDEINFGDTLAPTKEGQIEAQTYTRDDYLMLAVFSTAVKAMTPIWGTYTSVIKDDVGNNFEKYMALGLIEKSRVMTSEPALKLKRYSDVWAGRHANSSNASTEIGLPPEDMPKYFYSAAVVGRIPKHMFRVDKLLIASIYHSLDDLGKKLSKGPHVREVRGNDDDNEGESLPEQFRITQSIPDYIPVSMKTFCMDLPKLTQSVLGDLQHLSRVEEALNKLEKNITFSVSDFIYPIFDLALRNALFTSVIPNLERDEVIRCLAVTSIWLELNGFNALAEIVLAERFDKDPHEIEYGGIPMNPLRKEMSAALVELFPYNFKTSKTAKIINPGTDYITDTVQFVNRYSWSCGNAPFQNMRNDLAELVILADK